MSRTFACPAIGSTCRSCSCFGNDRALLLDTGATKEPDAFPLRETVNDLVATWLSDHPRNEYRLVVAHSHGHGDHVAGDGRLADRPHTTVVGKQPDAGPDLGGSLRPGCTSTMTS